jgi:hypothetical protein
MLNHIDNVDFAVDEHIWGHRLYDEQLPHLTVLEFLCILEANKDNPLNASAESKVRYNPQRQIRLRSLIFNNPYIEVVRAKSLPDADKWNEWEGLFLSNSTGFEGGELENLRAAFSSFDDFAKAIELLRSSAFEVQSQKRWSSKFVFPFGTDALYEDLRFGTNGVSNDRRFFARTGELLFLMLCRAGGGPALGKVLVDRLFSSTTSMNRLVRVLQGPAQRADSERETGYLPLPSHPRYDQLCEDWTAILKRDMPIYDALEHLITMAGLNLLLYFLERGKEVSGDTEPVEILCEIVSRERTKVRSLSGVSYQTNQALSLRAVRSTVEEVRLTPEWAEALQSDDPSRECGGVMQAKFQWPSATPDDDEPDYTTMPPDELISQLVKKSEDRHRQHVGKVHSTWSRAIGLSSKRLSRRTRYAPDDRLLKTLVLTIVDGRMQFDEFLAELRLRYGLVIGDTEGAHLVREKLLDQEALSENRSNLEARLVSLGLVRRLSDSCSFVENPFMADVETI